MSKITQQKKRKKQSLEKPVLGTSFSDEVLNSIETPDFQSYWLVDVNNKQKVMEFLQRFNVKPAILNKKKLIPVFIYNPFSTYGEEAEVIGIFSRSYSDELFIVTGSECSMWDFNGQFKPEAMSIAAIQHLVLNGTYGADTYSAELLKFLNKMIPDPIVEMESPTF